MKMAERSELYSESDQPTKRIQKTICGSTGVLEREKERSESHETVVIGLRASFKLLLFLILSALDYHFHFFQFFKFFFFFSAFHLLLLKSFRNPSLSYQILRTWLSFHNQVSNFTEQPKTIS